MALYDSPLEMTKGIAKAYKRTIRKVASTAPHKLTLEDEKEVMQFLEVYRNSKVKSHYLKNIERATYSMKKTGTGRQGIPNFKNKEPIVKDMIYYRMIQLGFTRNQAVERGYPLSDQKGERMLSTYFPDYQTCLFENTFRYLCIKFNVAVSDISTILQYPESFPSCDKSPDICAVAMFQRMFPKRGSLATVLKAVSVNWRDYNEYVAIASNDLVKVEATSSDTGTNVGSCASEECELDIFCSETLSVESFSDSGMESLSAGLSIDTDANVSIKEESAVESAVVDVHMKMEPQQDTTQDFQVFIENFFETNWQASDGWHMTDSAQETLEWVNNTHDSPTFDSFGLEAV